MWVYVRAHCVTHTSKGRRREDEREMAELTRSGALSVVGQFQMFMASQARVAVPRVASVPAQVSQLPLTTRSASPPPSTSASDGPTAPAATVPATPGGAVGVGVDHSGPARARILGPAEVVCRAPDAVQAICINQVR
jgi:hypothetical protein